MKYRQGLFFLIAAFLFTHMLLSCGGHHKEASILGVRLTYKVPMYTQGSSFAINNVYDVFYFGNYILYSIPYRFDSLYNGSLVSQSERSRYFVYHRDSLFGRYYDPATTSYNCRVPVDTALQNVRFQNNRFDTLLHNTPDSAYTNEEGDLVKVYKPPLTNESPEVFTIYFYYTPRLVGIKESFSTALDNIPGSKLYRIVIQAHGAYYSEYHSAIPKREYVYEMRELPQEDFETAMTYFNMYTARIYHH